MTDASRPPDDETRRRRLLWIWIAAAAIPVLPEPARLLVAPFYPAGLAEVLERGLGLPLSALRESDAMKSIPRIPRVVGLCVLGWAPYLALTLGALMTDRRRTWIVLASLLAVLLAVTSAGCNMTLDRLAHGIR